MKKIMIFSVLFGLVLAGNANAARVDYLYTGADTINQTIVLEGDLLNQVLINPPTSGAATEIGTLFILNSAPWGVNENYPAVIDSGGNQTTVLRGQGLFYDNTPVSFTINPGLSAKVVPYVVINGQKYFFDTAKVRGLLNGHEMPKSDGQNFDLNLVVPHLPAAGIVSITITILLIGLAFWREMKTVRFVN